MDKSTYTYKRVGECPIEADVYVPAAAGARPGVVWIHGGALICGSRGGINPEHLRGYLQAGYVVVSVDYRLAPETKLAGIIEDIRDAFRWVREEGPRVAPLDAERLAVVGHSAGGYLTLMTGTCVEPRPQALVSFYGYGELTGPWYAAPDPFYCRQPLVPEEEARGAVGEQAISRADGALGERRARFYLYCRQQGLWPREVVGYDPATEPEAFDPYCPVRHVGPDYPPTLLFHGDRDADVPYAESARMADALARAGVPHELVTISGGEHGFDYRAGDPAAAAAFGKALAFLSHHLHRAAAE